MKINEKNLVAFSVAPTVVQREGNLLKRGEVNRAFQKRWFVLKGNLLFYFEKRGDKEPLGVIIMEGCTIELAECEDQVCSFRVIFPAREYVLAAENQELLEGWMKSLARASYTYLKLMVAELEMQLQELNVYERQRAEDDQPAGADDSPPSAAARNRLNPFNTPEENRIFSQLWDPDQPPVPKEPGAVARPRSNTVTSNTTWHHTTEPSSDNNINNNNTEADQNHNSQFYTKEAAPTRIAPPIPPARKHRKSNVISSTGLKRPTTLNKVQKSDSTVSSQSSQSIRSGSSVGSATSTSSSSARQYFPFAQLHMDYGAPMLRDRELQRIQAGQCGHPDRPVPGERISDTDVQLLGKGITATDSCGVMHCTDTTQQLVYSSDTNVKRQGQIVSSKSNSPIGKHNVILNEDLTANVDA